MRLRRSLQLGLLLVASEIPGSLDEETTRRLIHQLVNLPIREVVSVMEKVDWLRRRPWDFKNLWEQHGESLKKLPRRRRARVFIPQRKRGYDDKGSAASVSERARREADQRGNLWGILDELSYTSRDYEEVARGDRWIDLLLAGTVAALREETLGER